MLEDRSAGRSAAARGRVSVPSDSERLRLLEAIGDVADGTHLLGETVQRVLDIIVPSFADVATLDVTSTTGEMRRLGARVEQPRSPALQAALLARHQSGDASVGVLKTLASGNSQLLAPVSQDVLRAIATSDADYELLCSLGLRETMYVPLTARGRTLGVLACSLRTPQRSFTAEDLRFAEVLSSRIGLALDNAGLSETVSGLERRLEATLANLAAGVIVRDTQGAMVFANQAGAELLGAASVEELFSLSSQQLMARFDAFDEHGRQLALEDLPSARALRGERPAPLVVRSIHRSAGVERWLLHKATPVFEPDGTLMLAVNVIEDITEDKRSELSQRLLAEAGRELSSSLDYQQTLQRVARLAVPGLADWCGVSISAGRVLEQVAVAHVDPDKVALAREWASRYPTRVEDSTGTADVLRTGRPQMVREITEQILATSGAGEEQLSLVRDLGMRSIIIVPLSIPGREPFGTLSLVMAESGRLFDAGDLAVAEELARRAATAVENARLYTERVRVARTLQRGLLPPTLPEVPGFRLASHYQPAGAHNEVGGDFYDAFAVSTGWMVVVGDVTGHGAEAAALTSLSRFTLRTAARLLNDPVAAVEQLNAALLEQPQLSLVSLCCALLRPADAYRRDDEATAEVLLAGHPPPYLVHRRRVVEVGEPAQLLGLDADGGWMTRSIRLRPDDMLVLYTDGVTDTRGETDCFGETRLAATIRDASDPSDAIRRIDAALTEFGRGPQRDDKAVIAVQRTPVLSVSAPRSPGPPTELITTPPLAS